jgi:TonB family protein
MSAASTRVELRVWTDPSGRISKVQLIRSTGDPELDAVIQSVVGLKLREPPPRDIPMPMIARLTARRPE